MNRNAEVKQQHTSQNLSESAVVITIDRQILIR